eukprot:1113126-Rhodomonas_salina.3
MLAGLLAGIDSESFSFQAWVQRDAPGGEPDLRCPHNSTPGADELRRAPRLGRLHSTQAVGQRLAEYMEVSSAALLSAL